MPNIRKPFSPTSNKYYLYNTTCNLPPPPQMFVFSKQTFEFYFRNCFWFNWNIQKCKQSFLQVDEKYFDIILVIFKIILHKVNFNFNTFKLVDGRWKYLAIFWFYLYPVFLALNTTTVWVKCRSSNSQDHPFHRGNFKRNSQMDHLFANTVWISFQRVSQTIAWRKWKEN